MDGLPRFGTLLRSWRTERGHSQLELGLSAGVSARHLSYLETGRASPSREMVLTLAQALELPLRERNQLLEAAGYAPAYRETPLAAESLGPVREALGQMLRAAEPNPVLVINRRYDLVDANRAGTWLLETFCADPSAFSDPRNVARILASPQGMRPFVANWEQVAHKVLVRLTRELGRAPQRDAADEALLEAIAPALRELGLPPAPLDPPALFVPLKLERGDLRLELFATVATVGTPLDVTLQELRIETFFPVDAGSKAILEAAHATRMTTLPKSLPAMK